MKTTINFWQFREAFTRMDRQNNFPGNGLAVLWDYFEQLEEDLGEELELDVLAVCCEYCQDHWQDIAENCRIDLECIDNEEERKAAVVEYLQENTCFVGEANDRELIYQVF